MKKKHKAEYLASHIILIIAALIVLYPFIFMTSGAFKSDLEFNRNILELIPKEFTLANFKTLFTKIPFVRQMMNSFFVAGVAVVGGILVSCMVAYGFTRFKFKGKNILFTIILATMLIPPQVMLIPQFQMYKNLGFVGTYIPLVIPAFTDAFSIYLICQYMGQIPKELFESAMIDGCGEMKIFLKIAIPLSKSGIAVQSVLIFMRHWNDYMNPLIYLNDEAKYTLSVGLMKLQDFYKISYGSSLAGALLTCIPVIVLLAVVGQKYFIEGLMAGAVKG